MTVVTRLTGNPFDQGNMPVARRHVSFGFRGPEQSDDFGIHGTCNVKRRSITRYDHVQVFNQTDQLRQIGLPCFVENARRERIAKGFDDRRVFAGSEQNHQTIHLINQTSREFLKILGRPLFRRPLGARPQKKTYGVFFLFKAGGSQKTGHFLVRLRFGPQFHLVIKLVNPGPAQYLKLMFNRT